MNQGYFLTCFSGICRQLTGYGLAVLVSVGCSSATTRERMEEKRSSARPRGASYAADGFNLDHRLPEPLPNEKWEFFYKHCNLEGRTPYPKRSDWNCTAPY